MREELINAGDSLTVNGRIYGLRFVAASPLSAWTPDGTTIARPVSALREVRPDHNPGWWSVVKLAAGAGGPLQVEIADSEDDEFGELAGVPLNLDASGNLKVAAAGAPVRLANGNILNQPDGTLILSTQDPSPGYSTYRLLANGTLGGGTFNLQLAGKLASGTFGVPSAASGGVGSGGAAEVQAGPGIGSGAVANAVLFPIRLGAFRALCVLAGSLNVNNLNWELWGFP